MERQVLNSGKGSKEILPREVIFKLNVEVCQGDRKKRPFLAEKKPHRKVRIKDTY